MSHKDFSTVSVIDHYVCKPFLYLRIYIHIFPSLSLCIWWAFFHRWEDARQMERIYIYIITAMFQLLLWDQCLLCYLFVSITYDVTNFYIFSTHSLVIDTVFVRVCAYITKFAKTIVVILILVICLFSMRNKVDIIGS